MRCLKEIDSRVHFVILTDGDSKLCNIGNDWIQLVAVPKAFTPSKAKYKARALEYFRIAMRFEPQDWILHLDEETAVDEHCVRACFDFIERSSYDYGQVM